MPVRKLLVASQKSGIGKTTTSINLAAAAALAGTRVLLLDADPLSNVSTALHLGSHPFRRPLRQSGVDLPGVLVCDVLPGLDVLSPYEAGACSDADLDDLLRLLNAPQFQASYGCLVVDAPPFLGANPGQLVGACDGYVIVMRAEPLAHRTLPAFLELVQRSRRDRPASLHGILLTLPEGEPPGGRWERELRGRLGARVFQEAIPYDEEAGLAVEKGLILTQTAPESPAGAPYHRLAAALHLADNPVPLKKAVGAAALAAAAALQPVGAGAPAHGPVRPASPVRTPVEEAPDETPDVESLDELDLPPRPSKPSMPSFANLRVAPPSLTLPAFNPPPAARAKLQPVPTGPEEEPSAPTAPKPGAAAPGGTLPWFVAVGLAVVVGVGLRFVHLPDFMLPVAVGLAVAAAVVLALRVLAATPEAPPKPLTVLAAPSPRKTKNVEKSDGRRDASARLASLTRNSPSGSYRRPRRK